MPSFDRITLTSEQARLIARIDEFKGAWRALGVLAPQRLNSLRQVATIESIGSSNRIEGNTLTDTEVAALLRRAGDRALDDRNEQEVVGYAKAIELLLASWQDLRFTENHIRHLHQVLLAHSERDAWHRGRYKTNPNTVAAFDAEGQQVGIVIRTAEPFETPIRMAELVEWVGDHMGRSQHHPLVVIAIATVVFLEIHSFQDGHGRLSRVLTTLLLLKAGYAYVPFSSLERVVEQNREAYYLALRGTQGTLRTDAPDFRPWFDFFFRALGSQVEHLRGLVEHERDVLAPLPDLSLAILEAARARGRITMAEAIAATGKSRGTLKGHFASLVARGHLARHGRGRGVWYELRVHGRGD